MIADEHVEEMKRRLKIFHTAENKHIESLLKQSYKDISYRCQSFVMGESLRGTELVYERTRYAYNDLLEYFHENFISQITSFALENMEEEDYEE
ncbi:phage gp6-like head-tail connector protein [Staphylococcus nepalensis]|uniref:phage gp6-like head-tail connector protein n=1 Tax=Staphylococcus nepalensis TaxID=214473 RepID=UPI001C3EB074|nr:phage gp6-like head-tail connector protein [Staphylococcus nepalensis]